MKPHELKPGQFYISARNHWVYVATKGRALVCVGRAYECAGVGSILAPDEGEESRMWRFLRLADAGEVVRAVTEAVRIPL